MNKSSLRHKILLCAFLAASSATTASSQTNVEVVAQTLQAYQVGKTTIEDFIRDANLVNATFPELSNSQPHPAIGFLLTSTFRTTPGSPWKIYETAFEQGQDFGFHFTQTRKYVVGNIKTPICILAFGNNGKLTSITHVTNSTAFPAESLAQKPDSVSHTVKAAQNIEIVAQTLKTYQVGKTTREDFIRDADLMEITNSPFPAGHLNPHPLTDPFEGNVLITRTGGPWKIYNFHVEFGNIKKDSNVTPIQQYLVGDIKKPLCFLTFDNKGRLTNISPPPTAHSADIK